MDTNPYSPLRAVYPVLTAAAMREADRFTIEDYGIPGITLMESAGRSAADRIEQYYGPLKGKTVACYCGKGNNGGDGMVVARQLYAVGAYVHVVTMDDEPQMSRDAAFNMGLLRKLASHDADKRLYLHSFEKMEQLIDIGEVDIHVDALLGTGLTSALREPLSGLVEWINNQPQSTVALDIPTGLHSDFGTILGTAVKADLTVTMGAFKTGLLINDGPGCAGKIDVVEIGIPAFVLDRVSKQSGCGVCAMDESINSLLPKRSHHDHKYSVGLALIIAGSPGMTGAPAMASSAAARVGAGFVVCACPDSIQPIMSTKMTEVTTVALPTDDNDGIRPEEAISAVAERLGKARALLVGCGMGRNPNTVRFIHQLLKKVDVPVVIDADGLNALVGQTHLFHKYARGRWILTPHEGEFKRLAGINVHIEDRIQLAQEYAARWNCVLLLKGLPSIVAGPDGQTYINRTGNPALASAGTGDVLAGMCVGLLAQGLSPIQAAFTALHIGGAAADRYVGHYPPRTMQAMDLVQQLRYVFKERFQ